MNLYISDLHFGHRNVLQFDHRPFREIDEMDAALIKLWNMRVDADDHIYMLGDICYKSDKSEEWYLRQLKGHKHLVVGNHDRHLLTNEKAMSYFESVDTIKVIEDGDNFITMCHYPLASYNRENYGGWHIYGHIHSRKDEVYDFMKHKERALNAGCMINNYAPASLNELIRNNRYFRERA